MPKKTIRCFCHGPITLGYQSPWEDVWIQYFNGKRNRVSEGPCIISRKDIEGWIDFHKEYLAKKKHNLEWYSKTLVELENILKELDSGPEYVISDPNPKECIPNIYVNSDYIDKQIVEQALEWYLRKKGVLKSKPRFQWDKPDLIVTPVGF